MFNMELGEAPDPEASAVDHNKLEEQVKELSQALTGTKNKCSIFSSLVQAILSSQLQHVILLLL